MSDRLILFLLVSMYKIRKQKRPQDTESSTEVSDSSVYSQCVKSFTIMCRCTSMTDENS